MNPFLRKIQVDFVFFNFVWLFHALPKLFSPVKTGSNFLGDIKLPVAIQRKLIHSNQIGLWKTNKLYCATKNTSSFRLENIWQQINQSWHKQINKQMQQTIKLDQTLKKILCVLSLGLSCLAGIFCCVVCTFLLNHIQIHIHIDKQTNKRKHLSKKNSSVFSLSGWLGLVVVCIVCTFLLNQLTSDFIHPLLFVNMFNKSEKKFLGSTVAFGEQFVWLLHFQIGLSIDWYHNRSRRCWLCLVHSEDRINSLCTECTQYISKNICFCFK